MLYVSGDIFIVLPLLLCRKFVIYNPTSVSLWYNNEQSVIVLSVLSSDHTIIEYNRFRVTRLFSRCGATLLSTEKSESALFPSMECFVAFWTCRREGSLFYKKKNFRDNIKNTKRKLEIENGGAAEDLQILIRLKSFMYVPGYKGVFLTFKRLPKLYSHTRLSLFGSWSY